ARRARADVLDRLAEVAEDGRHRAGLPHAALVHQLTASPNDAETSVECERAGGMISGELTERMTGGGPYPRRDPLTGDGPQRGAVREQCGLGVVRECELLGWSVEAESGERCA